MDLGVAVFVALATTCHVLLFTLERFLEREAREKGRALLEGEIEKDEGFAWVARLLLVFFPTCRMPPESAPAPEDGRSRSESTAARIQKRRASLAAVCVLQAPLDEKRGQEIRERPVIFALLKVLDHALCIFGPSYVCFDLPNCGLALRTAAVARVLVPACATLDVAVGQVATLMDLDREQAAGFKILNYSVRGFVWTLSGILVLHALGFEVSNFYNNLGLWGVVIGYASRNILEDLFAGLLIVYRRWFIVGDYVVVGGVAGTVEEVAVTSTKIKLFCNGERIHMANSKILASGVVNHRERDVRRISKYYHLAHDSDPAKVKAFLGALDAALDRDDVRPLIRKFGRAPYFGAHVMNLGLDGIEVELVYFTPEAGAPQWKQIETEVNLAALAALRDLGLRLAVRAAARSS